MTDPAAGALMTGFGDGEPTVANPYHYVDNDPLNKVDPLGLRPEDDEFDQPPTPSPVPRPCMPWGIPSAPPRPSSDAGAGEWGSEPWYSTGNDRVVKDLAYAAADFADHVKGWGNAADNLRHYLGNSGDTQVIDPDRIAGDVSQFQRHLETQVQNAVEATAEQAVVDGDFGCPIPFITGWSGFYIDSGMSQDWFYALGGLSTAATGLVTVTQGNPPRVEVRFQSHLFDRYNWDEGKSTQIGPFTITDEQLAELHRAGVAREYDVVGSTETHSYSCVLGSSCSTTVGSGSGSGGRR